MLCVNKIKVIYLLRVINIGNENKLIDEKKVSFIYPDHKCHINVSLTQILQSNIFIFFLCENIAELQI